MEDGIRLKQVHEYYLEHKILPTYREMARMFGYDSANASVKFVKRMIKAGYIKKIGRRIAPTDRFMELV